MEIIATFLRAASHNLRYTGIDVLARMVRVPDAPLRQAAACHFSAAKPLQEVCNAAKSAAAQLTSDNIRLGCGPQVRLNPKYAAEHQLAVIDCLEDPDPTLKKKTLELLFKMAKPNNVEVRQSSLTTWYI